MNETIADRIKRIRLEKEMSQSDLAKMAGYSDKTAISKLEHAGDNISIKQVKRIANALNCPPEHLMGWRSVTDDNGVEITYCPKDSNMIFPITILNSNDSEKNINRIKEYINKLHTLPDERKEEIYKQIDFQIYQCEQEKK